MERIAVQPYRDLDYIFRYRPPKQASRILDCGCEGGGRALAIAQRGVRNVVGVDASAHRIAAARERARKHRLHVPFVEAKPWATPFHTKSFDEILLLSDVFAHGRTLRADMDLLIEMRRLLAPNGMLWISLPDGEWLRQYHAQRETKSSRARSGGRITQLTENDRCLQTLVTEQGETGVATETILYQWLYDRRQIAGLLHLLCFEAISYHTLPSLPTAVLMNGTSVPRLLVHCLAPARF
jgi:SAM-dependent methyltransferase